MSLNRRTLALASASAFVASTLMRAVPAVAEGPDEAAVGKQVEALRVAMLKADKAAFEQLCAAELSYGHSGGRIETKAEFIAGSTSGKSTWNTIDFNDRTVRVAGPTAVARFMLVGQTLSEGKTTDIKIGVLTVWAKQGADWKLLARQAFRV